MAQQECSRCGSIFDQGDMLHDQTYGYLCRGCYNSGWKCDVCGSWHPSSDCNYRSYGSAKVCPTCQNSYRFRKSYHDSPDLIFFDVDGKHQHPVKEEHFGIELEFTNGNDYYRLLKDLWPLYEIDDEDGIYEIYYNSDSSIGYDTGIELITQPHTITALRKMKWKKILEKIQEHGYSSHDAGNCGLHIHVSRRFFGKEKATQDRVIQKLINFIDVNWEDFLKFSRRTEEQAEDWADRYFTNKTKDQMGDRSNIRDYKCLKDRYTSHNSRYHAVNITNENTIEIRIMRGTLNYNTFMASIDFIYRIIVNCKVIPYSKLADTKLWLRGLKPETIEYLRHRNAFVDYLPETHE